MGLCSVGIMFVIRSGLNFSLRLEIWALVRFVGWRLRFGMRVSGWSLFFEF